MSIVAIKVVIISTVPSVYFYLFYILPSHQNLLNVTRRTSNNSPLSKRA